MTDRRQFIRQSAALLAGSYAGLSYGHTPYQQWVVYRKKHLMIGCHRENLETWEIAKKIQALLETELPDARARIARAKTAGRLASLLGTDQLDTAVLSKSVAKAMMDGNNGFEPYGAIDLRTVAQLDKYLYVVRADLPGEHAGLLADALMHLDAYTVSKVKPEVPWHDALL